MKLALVDRAIIACYFLAVLAIGFSLRRRVKDSEDFLLSRHQIPLWITGISFMAANLGSLEIMGMISNGAKYGMLTNHFYWVGAIPAMVFLGVFMVRFYYQNNVRSVPEYLKRRAHHHCAQPGQPPPPPARSKAWFTPVHRPPIPALLFPIGRSARLAC